MGFTNQDSASWLFKFVVELIGTFLFLSVILVTAGLAIAPFAIGLALAIMIFFAGFVTGGAFNPAVALSLALSGKMSWPDYGVVTAAQFAGAVAAWGYWEAARKLEFVLPNEILTDEVTMP